MPALRPPSRALDHADQHDDSDPGHQQRVPVGTGRASRVTGLGRHREEHEPEHERHQREPLVALQMQTERERGDDGSHADAAGNRRLHHEQRQRAQRDDRREKADQVEREAGHVGHVAGQAHEEHRVEVRAHLGPARGQGLHHRADAVAQRSEARAHERQRDRHP